MSFLNACRHYICFYLGYFCPWLENVAIFAEGNDVRQRLRIVPTSSKRCISSWSPTFQDSNVHEERQELPVYDSTA